MSFIWTNTHKKKKRKKVILTQNASSFVYLIYYSPHFILKQQNCEKITEPHMDPRVLHAMECDIWITRKEKDRGYKTVWVKWLRPLDRCVACAESVWYEWINIYSQVYSQIRKGERWWEIRNLLWFQCD